MVMGWDDAAIGGIAAGGNIIGGLISAQSARANADHAMDRQREMSDTAHVREVEDLKRAGLNPVLSAGGSGASTPTMSAPDGPDLAGAVGSGINTAMAHKNMKADLDFKEAQTDLAHDQATNLASDRSIKTENTKLLRSQTEQVNSNIQFQDLKNRYMRETLDAQIKEAKAKGDWAQVNMLLGAVGGTAKAIAPFIP